ncbi:MAG TPA: IS91 family transposase [Acidobacteriaceae bacterium]
MTQPAVEVADILRAQGDRFLNRYRPSFSYQQGKVFRAIRDCRTPALGGHLDTCPECGKKRCDRPPAISYNSCRNRHCPKCQTEVRQRWLAAREHELIPTGYFHVVFTVPHELNVLALENARLFYELLFTASAATAIELARDPQHLGAEIGMLSILHTWGQNLLLHPHIHCVIPMGGLSPQHTRWVRSPYPFFLPKKALKRVFRGKFLAGLKRLYRRKQLRCGGPASLLADPKQFAHLLRRMHRHDWVVHVKPALGDPSQVLRYLGRYTHRVAISNHRLVSFDGERVTFRWKDYAHGSKQKMMTLSATEFLRRFFLHVLPKGFVRIRYFGFLANRWRTRMLALARQLLGTEPSIAPEPVPQTSALWRCPRCGARMVILRRFTAVELRGAFFDSS